MKFQFTKHNLPILTSSELPFETKAVYNPTVIKKDSKIYMLYRAESHDQKTGCIGLAWSSDGIHFEKHPEPVLVPGNDYDERGCEDPRVVELDGVYYMAYVPLGRENNGLSIALASSEDLFHWTKLGPIQMSLEGWCADKIKAPALAPIRVNGKYVLYFMGQKRSWHTAIGVAYSSDLIHWTEDPRNPILIPRYDNLDCLGVEPGPTPLIAEDQILLFYNAWDETFTHRAWLSSFDLSDPGRLCSRGETPLLSPEYDWECCGHVKNILFAEGIVQHDGRYFLYYGASDTSIGVAVSDGAHA